MNNTSTRQRRGHSLGGDRQGPIKRKKGPGKLARSEKEIDEDGAITKKKPLVKRRSEKSAIRKGKITRQSEQLRAAGNGGKNCDDSEVKEAGPEHLSRRWVGCGHRRKGKRTERVNATAKKKTGKKATAAGAGLGGK